MTTLRDIRRRLRSVENIKKITDAMERVAAARLRRAQAKAEQSRPYASKIKEILENLASKEAIHPLFEKRETKKIGLVVISADRGLSGSYNSTILSAANRFLKKYNSDQVELILIGRKALEHFRGKEWKIRDQKTKWGGKITYLEIEQISNNLVNWFLTKEFDEIWIIYTRYITVMSGKVIVEKFLNIEKSATTAKPVNLNYIFEPSPEKILAELLPRYCITRVQTALNEAYASELAARIVAMRMASKNSEEMITRLTLLRNKMRQSSITKEMIEISLGANEIYE